MIRRLRSFGRTCLAGERTPLDAPATLTAQLSLWEGDADGWRRRCRPHRFGFEVTDQTGRWRHTFDLAGS